MKDLLQSTNCQTKSQIILLLFYESIQDCPTQYKSIAAIFFCKMAIVQKILRYITKKNVAVIVVDITSTGKCPSAEI